VGVGTNNVSASPVRFPGRGRKLTNPVKALVSKSIHTATHSAKSALRNATIVGQALLGVKSARTKYTESILEYEKQLKAIKENQKLQKRINTIVNNVMRQLASENARKTHMANKASALRKLKNNLKATRNLLSPTHHTAYNKYARVLIKNIFDPLFNKWALAAGNRQAIESMEKSSKEAIAALINLNKKQKAAKAAEESSEEAMRIRAQKAERNRKVRAFRELQAKQAAANAAARLRRQVDKMVEEAEKFEKPAKQTGYRPGVYSALTTTQKRSGSLAGPPRKTNRNKTN
jgi:chemotaxis protein histidine kinase CheA